MLYYLEKNLGWLALCLLTRCQVKGRENVPAEGTLLVVANHNSVADPLLLGVHLGRRVTFMAKEELFRSRFVAYCMRSFGAFPVHKRRVDRDALRQADRLLNAGQVLIMFPEGKRSDDAGLQPGRLGSALIASKNGVPILPVGISGTERIRGFGWLPYRPEVLMNVGRPFHLPAPVGKLTKSGLAEQTDIIMGHIAELLPEKYRGHYARGTE